MIHFACHCGEALSVPGDLAGSSIQCPRCGRLNDVPLLGDLGHIEADGSFKLADPTAEVEARRLQNLKTAFMRARTTEDGREIDLRPTMSDIQRVGIPEEIALGPDGITPTSTPKYDPTTGELIRPVALAPPEETLIPDAIPLARQAAGPDHPDPEGPRTLAELLIDLLDPVNLIVMAFIVVGYLLAQAVQLILVPLAQNAGGHVDLARIAPTVPLLAFLLGHYANVIEETGPLGKDHLPRPLRSLDIGDDLFRPMIRMFLAIVLAYWPLVVVVQASAFLPARVDMDWRVQLLLLALGTWALPATALTAACGGMLLNFRPDRILSVMTACGWRYLVAVALWMATVTMFLVIMAVLCTPLDAATAREAMIYRRLADPTVFYPLLCLSIYLTHAACVYLGMIYRRHGTDFEWAHQRHVRAPRQERPPAARLSRERAESPGGPAGRDRGPML